MTVATSAAPAIALREAESADAAQLRTWFIADCAARLGALPAELFELQWVARQTSYATHHPAAVTYVIETGVGEEPVGALTVDRSTPTTHLVDLVVAADHRRRGAATAALDALVAEGRPVTLEVRIDNAAARRLYERFGFVVDEVTDTQLRMLRPAVPLETARGA